MYWLPALVAAISVSAFCVTGCDGKGSHSDDGYDLPDTMNVVTLYGPASYFQYKDTTMGYDYDMMEELAQEHYSHVNWLIANSIEEAILMVDEGEALLLASNVPAVNSFKKQVLLCGPETYYRDPVVKHGYSRGRETVDYVDRIWTYYSDAIEKIAA